MYIRLTKTVEDRGNLILPEEVYDKIDSLEIDWYYSPFNYGDDALEYFEEHKRSIKGYTGKVFTHALYWDLDCKEDFSKAHEAALKLCCYLSERGYEDGLEVFFSGNKGFHVFLHTENELNPQQTKKICYNVAVKAGVSQEIFDTTVYNINRIFRVPHTKHQVSGLYKIPIKLKDLIELSSQAIRDLAKNTEHEAEGYENVDATELIEEFGTILEPEVQTNNVIDLESVKKLYGEDFNPLDCPQDKRRCIYILENGYFGPGERENASIRIAAYEQAQGKSREETRDILLTALNKRNNNYKNLNTWNKADVERVLDEVYSENWNGGAYSCRSDEYLKSKCDLGNGCCANEKKDNTQVNAIKIGSLIDRYVEYSNEALLEYPKMGLDWVDAKVRFRPRNYSIINGANGSGKTSLALEFIDHLNLQKIWHIIFSLDMADTSFFEKIGAKHTKFSQKEIEAAFNVHTRNETVIQEVGKVLKEKYPYTLFDFTSSVDVYYIENTVQALKGREIDPINLQVVFIDYAGRVIGDKDNEYSNATEIALRANDVAKRTNTHLCFLSQIPREDGDHTKSIRSSRVSKSSGAWEENATVVINCWRPFGNGIRNLDRYIHIYIAKNRSGELGERVFFWDGKSGKVFEMDKRSFAEYYNLCEQHGKEEPEPQFGDDDISVANNPMFSQEKPKAKVAFNAPKKLSEEDEVEAYIDQQESNDARADVKEMNERKVIQHSKKFGRSGTAFNSSEEES